jgi:hypothetical protein
MRIMQISEKDHEVEDIDNLLFVMLIDQRSTKQSGSNYIVIMSKETGAVLTE